MSYILKSFRFSTKKKKIPFRISRGEINHTNAGVQFANLVDKNARHIENSSFIISYFVSFSRGLFTAYEPFPPFSSPFADLNKRRE